MLGKVNYLGKKEASQLPVLILAYIGDAVYELLIRDYLLTNEKKKVKELHKKTVELVRAEAQARILEKIKPFLVQNEALIVRRARNVKIDNHPKGVELIDYRKATALEALIGYLYLSSDNQRIYELFQLIEINQTYRN